MTNIENPNPPDDVDDKGPKDVTQQAATLNLASQIGALSPGKEEQAAAQAVQTLSTPQSNPQG